MVTKLRAVLVPLMLAVMIALAGLACGRIYHGPLLTKLLLGAAVASVLISVALSWLPAWTVAPTSVVGLAAYTLLAVRLAAQAGGIDGGLVPLTLDAIRNCIPRLLTATIPVEPQPDTVVLPVAAVWLAGLAGTELAVRFRRVLFSYAAPTLLYIGALYLVGPNARGPLWQSMAYAGAAAIGLAVTARTSDEPPPAVPAQQRWSLRARTMISVGAGFLAVVLVGLLVGPWVAGRVSRTPTDPRQYVPPPHVDDQDENPLIRISGWASNPDQKLLESNLSTAGNIRLAVLSDYDGVTWRVGASYRTAGRVLPALAPPPGSSPLPDGQDGGTPPALEVKQQLKVVDLEGRLLPAMETPKRVDGIRVAYDLASGTLVRPEGLQPGLSYEVASMVRKPNLNLLPVANVPSGPAVARYLKVGDSAPEELTKLVNDMTASVSGMSERATALEQYLSEHHTFDAKAPSGHAYPNLKFFLKGAGGRKGTSEQFAAAFAVLGRMMGLPTRVAVGFKGKAGAGVVKAGDAYAWPEVLYEGIGWVPYDPLPKGGQARPIEEPKPKPPPPSQPPPPSVLPSVSPMPSASASSAPAAVAGPRTSPALVAVGWSSGGMMLLLLALLTIVLLRRARRRGRLDRGSPSARVAGAWHEVLDGLRLVGQHPDPHLTASPRLITMGARP